MAYGLKACSCHPLIVTFSVSVLFRTSSLCFPAAVFVGYRCGVLREYWLLVMLMRHLFSSLMSSCVCVLQFVSDLKYLQMADHSFAS